MSQINNGRGYLDGEDDVLDRFPGDCVPLFVLLKPHTIVWDATCKGTKMRYIAPSVSSESSSDKHVMVDAKATRKTIYRLACRHTLKQTAATTKPGSLE